jgi:hypothetical protein
MGQYNEIFQTFIIFLLAFFLIAIFFPFYYFCEYRLFFSVAMIAVVFVPVVNEWLMFTKTQRRISEYYCKICYIVVYLSVVHFVLFVLYHSIKLFI